MFVLYTVRFVRIFNINDQNNNCVSIHRSTVVRIYGFISSAGKISFIRVSTLLAVGWKITFVTTNKRSSYERITTLRIVLIFRRNDYREHQCTECLAGSTSRLKQTKIRLVALLRCPARSDNAVLSSSLPAGSMRTVFGPRPRTEGLSSLFDRH